MIDELLGKLEPASVKFGIGRGGLPELTPQDVAAALGMCEDRFAATIFHVTAGGTIADWQGIDRMLAELQFGEWRKRADRLLNAQLAKASANISGAAQNAELHTRADMLLAGARAAMWPALIEATYAKMRKALIAELRASRTCQACQGRGTLMVDAVVEGCRACLATGMAFVSDRQRAEMIGVDHSTYRRNRWKAVYEWMYRELIDAAANGREQFEKAVDRLGV